MDRAPHRLGRGRRRSVASRVIGASTSARRGVIGGRPSAIRGWWGSSYGSVAHRRCSGGHWSVPGVDRLCVACRGPQPARRRTRSVASSAGPSWAKGSRSCLLVVFSCAGGVARLFAWVAPARLCGGGALPFLTPWECWGRVAGRRSGRSARGGRALARCGREAAGRASAQSVGGLRGSHPAAAQRVGTRRGPASLVGGASIGWRGGKSARLRANLAVWVVGPDPCRGSAKESQRWPPRGNHRFPASRPLFTGSHGREASCHDLACACVWVALLVRIRSVLCEILSALA